MVHPPVAALDPFRKLAIFFRKCEPSANVLEDRYFKIKDRVENYLSDELKSGKMSLAAAQRGIASDWTQYLEPDRHATDGSGKIL